MATLSDIKKRIGSVKNTQKITKAMKMVAASKLRRAQAAVIGSRPFSNKLKELVIDIVSNTEEGGEKNPLFIQRENKQKVELLVFTSNKGLCGGFNSNLLRKTFTFLKDLDRDKVEYNLNVVGKKGREFFVSRQVEISNNYPQWADKLSYDEAKKYIEDAAERFIQGEIDEFYLVYNKFISAIKLETTFQKLLPLELEEGEVSYGVDYIYEPPRKELLKTLLPKYLATQVYKSHLESLASELGSRMSAMECATNNAGDMIGKLTLQYNSARQAAITTELMDIVNGAESLKA